MRLITIFILDIEKDKNELKRLLLYNNNNSPYRIIYIILLNQWIIIMMSFDSLKDKRKFLVKKMNVLDERKKWKIKLKE